MNFPIFATNPIKERQKDSIMFESSIYQKRRQALREKMSSGIILILGNNEAPANYPDNTYKFRQDSSFLYFFGHAHPGYAGIIDRGHALLQFPM